MEIIENLRKLMKGKGVSDTQIDSSLETLKFIYIGQNIRDQGILQIDEYIEKNQEVISILEKFNLVKENEWKPFILCKLYITTIEGSKVGAEIIKQIIDSYKDEIIKEIGNKPQPIINFLTHYYISDSLTFSVEGGRVFDWKNLVLEKEEVEHVRKFIFNLLKEKELCVITYNYVSTRGGEKREKKYVIVPELRKFLIEHFDKDILTKDQKEYGKILYLLEEKFRLEYETGKISIGGDELRRIGPIDTLYPKLKNLLEILKNENVITHLILSLGANFYFQIVERDAFKQFLDNQIKEKIINKILGLGEIISELEPRAPTYEETFSELISRLVVNKYNLYRAAAMFSGFELFISNPETEKNIINLLKPIGDEDGLKGFIGDLHRFLLESSKEEVLKFNPNATVKLEDLLGVTIPEEKINEYEDVKEIFRNLNKLRNHYSHLQNAQRYYEAGQIFYKLIDKHFPFAEEDIVKTQKVLLEKCVEALEKLTKILVFIKEREEI